MGGAGSGRKKKGSNGAASPGWEDVVKASAEREAAEKPKRGKGEQMRIQVDSRDAVRIPAKHQLRREMTHAEWEEQSALLARNRVELMGYEDEIRKLREKHAPRMKELKSQIDDGARQCDERKWLTVADCIEVHDVNTRTVTVYADVNGELGAEVVPPRKMRDEEYERAVKTSPFEPPPPALDPPDGEVVEDDEASDAED